MTCATVRCPSCPRPIWWGWNIAGRYGHGLTSFRHRRRGGYGHCAGRGSGKTRAAAEWVRSEVESGRRRSIALVGATADVLRRDMAAAILQVSRPDFMPVHEPSQRRITWPDGAIGHLLSAEEPNRIRGLNCDGGWGDEVTSWSNPADTWSNTMLALRIDGPKGDAPAMVVSTTPKRQPLIRAILKAPGAVATRSRTADNSANLAPGALKSLYAAYSGSVLGRQELGGELLDDMPGALWNRDLLERGRVAAAPPLRRIVVAIDPSGGSGASNDEVGIIVAGVSYDNQGYILADLSRRFSPDTWARHAVNAYQGFQADCIVAETNFDGAMVEGVVRAVNPSVPFKSLIASRGKAVRAEPVVAFYEQNRVHHVGQYPDLEDQLCSWDPSEPGKSPDRLDATVWAISELMGSAVVMPARWANIARGGGSPFMNR